VAVRSAVGADVLEVACRMAAASGVVRMTGAASGRRGGVLVTSDESAITRTADDVSWARVDVADEVRLLVL